MIEIVKRRRRLSLQSNVASGTVQGGPKNGTINFTPHNFTKY